jgi:hypothetical protein
VERILELRGQGLTAHHVFTFFLLEQVAPLQRRDHLMWAFTGVRDSTRLRKGRLSIAELDQRVNQLLRETQGALWLTEDLQLLHEHSDDIRAQILGKMPACDVRRPIAPSLGQPAHADLDGLRRRRQLVLSSDSEDEVQD